MPSFILFDLDGTLVNTLADLSHALNVALSENGFRTLTEAETSALVGHSVRYMCQNATPPEHAGEWQKVERSYATYYKRHCCDRSHPYAGMPEAVRRLKAAGKRMAVVSNKPHADAVTVVSTLYPRDTFQMVLGRMDRFAIKPAPDAIEFALGYFGVPKSEAVYVGDSEVDVEFAKNAGLPCLSVTWGFRTREALLDAGANTLIDTPKALLEKLL